MGVTNVQEKAQGTGATQTRERGVANQSGTISRSWTVLCDTPATAVTDALASGSMPAIGTAHPTLTDQYVVHRSVAIISPHLVELTCEYAGKTSPLSEPYERAWSYSNVAESIDKDSAGDLIVNSAGDPITGLTADVADLMYTVTRNEATFPEANARTYINTVNSDVYHGYSAGEIRMTNISGVYVPLAGASYYWRVTYQMTFRKGGWQLRTLDKGPRYRPAIGAALVSARDRLNVDEVLLDSDGVLIPDGDPPNWLDVTIYGTNNFAALGLG